MDNLVSVSSELWHRVGVHHPVADHQDSTAEEEEEEGERELRPERVYSVTGGLVE